MILCFLQQQCYSFNFFLSLNFHLCSACFNTFLFFTSVESLIFSSAFWSYIPDTTGGVSDPYYLKASCLYSQFSALIPISFHDIDKEKDCDLLRWHTQVVASKSVLSPNTIVAPDIMKICLHQLIFFTFLHAANSSVCFPTQFTFFSGAVEENYQDLEIDLLSVQDRNFPVSCMSLEFACT